MAVDQENKKSRRPGRRSCPEFLSKLVLMLQVEHPDIISWRSGQISLQDPNRLVTEVLKRYFRHANYNSFKRQLNYFGFRKIEGKGKMEPCIYANEDLEGADLEAILDIKRKTNSTEEDLAILQSIDPSLSQEKFSSPQTSESEAYDSSLNGHSQQNNCRSYSYPTYLVPETYPHDSSEGRYPQSETWRASYNMNGVSASSYYGGVYTKVEQSDQDYQPLQKFRTGEANLKYRRRTNLDDLIRLCEQVFEVEPAPTS
uniref:HSF-type DNA-binding domain-containing protein n=1 Tax=Fibrocapsa japonica TaxID=94617 RepID=A0A7S2V2P2_9STRA|mmetsp:Transcript_23285/g.33849  ORF Transcript_23285/g.33849 Transcript_23285/m.33849 type:complete len:257 (+) Transcript_23285:89-859(+)